MPRNAFGFSGMSLRLCRFSPPTELHFEAKLTLIYLCVHIGMWRPGLVNFAHRATLNAMLDFEAITSWNTSHLSCPNSRLFHPIKHALTEYLRDRLCVCVNVTWHGSSQVILCFHSRNGLNVPVWRNSKAAVSRKCNNV